MRTRTRKHAAPVVVAMAGMVLLLAGCGGDEPETASSPGQGTAAAAMSAEGAAAADESEDILGAPMHDALDKAEAVEDELMQQKQAIDEALDAAENEGL